MTEHRAFAELKEAEQSGLIKIHKKKDKDGVLNLSLSYPQGVTPEQEWDYLRLLLLSSGLIVKRSSEDLSKLSFTEKLKRRLHA